MTIFLEAITHDPKARMHWAHYWWNIVQRYLVVIEGWPENIPFVNLSTVSSTLPDLEMLLDKWETGEIHWKHLDKDKYEKLRQERHEKVSSGKVIEKRRQTRSDKGKKHDQPSNHSSHCRKTYKSAQTVISDDESDIPDDTASRKHTPAGTPKLTSSTPPASSFFNGDMFGMDFLPANSPGAGTSVDMRSEFNFDGISGMLDFINFE
ncbi:uncharacterized protein EDB93DRAFT_1101806 [Suillus bovinus]|uniref:uncharacterized protein n=1 Tax=Suillus bovinus TaxID=48563 RepID=UPI001B85E7D4|nr:uncharacterized protein EDB93DRAFT_1101806 [Suillus bovinus]KAG2155233.1 hypothetical protein EDB93DRAFT_1101806 [Suillus bovinus]